MATTVAWHTVRLKWMVDNLEGTERYFDDKGTAIQCAISLEKNKDNPDRVLAYKKDGQGIADNIPVR